MNPVNLLVIWYFGFVDTSPDQNVTVAGEKINLNIERLSVRITVTGKKRTKKKSGLCSNMFIHAETGINSWLKVGTHASVTCSCGAI